MRLLFGVLLMACLYQASDAAQSASVPMCHGPAMKLLHYEIVPMSAPDIPAGDVIVEFTVDVAGAVSDPLILNSSDARLESYVLRSAVLWRYAASANACRHKMQIVFQPDTGLEDARRN